MTANLLVFVLCFAMLCINSALSDAIASRIATNNPDVYSIDNTTNFLNNRQRTFKRQDSDPPAPNRKTCLTGYWLVRFNLLDAIQRRHPQAYLWAFRPRRNERETERNRKMVQQCERIWLHRP